MELLNKTEQLERLIEIDSMIDMMKRRIENTESMYSFMYLTDSPQYKHKMFIRKKALNRLMHYYNRQLEKLTKYETK